MGDAVHPKGGWSARSARAIIQAMTTTKAQQRALLTLMQDQGGLHGTTLLGSGALLVRHNDGQQTIIERNGRAAAV